MDKKKLAIRILGLVAAVGLPAGIYKGYRHWNGGNASPSTPAPAAVPAGDAEGLIGAGGQLGPDGRLGPQPRRAQNIALAEVLNFNVTPDWIMRRWPRVSTGLSYLQLQGYRAPLVTGTAQDDLAGSLTYYFNPHQQVHRITFLGSTGDWRKLVSVLTAQHRLTRRLTNDPGLMVYEAVHPNGKPASVCTIRTEPIIKASDVYHRYTVDLVLERPQGQKK